MPGRQAGGENGILFAQTLAIGGVVMNRLNITYFSQNSGGFPYTSSWMELAIATILVLYRAAVLYLPIVKHAEAGR